MNGEHYKRFALEVTIGMQIFQHNELQADQARSSWHECVLVTKSKLKLYYMHADPLVTWRQLEEIVRKVKG